MRPPLAWLFIPEKGGVKTGNDRIALALAFARNLPMLVRVLSAVVNGIEAFPVEAGVNSGWGEMAVVMDGSILPTKKLAFLPRKNPLLSASLKSAN